MASLRVTVAGTVTDAPPTVEPYTLELSVQDYLPEPTPPDVFFFEAPAEVDADAGAVLEAPEIPIGVDEAPILVVPPIELAPGIWLDAHGFPWDEALPGGPEGEQAALLILTTEGQGPGTWYYQVGVWSFEPLDADAAVLL